jgi:hypothetical protein
MTPATLTPPESPTASPTEAVPGASVPAFIVRAPLGRNPRREPTGRLTRSAVAASVALHLLLAAAFLLAPAGRSSRLADSGTREDPQFIDMVEYLDIGQWPDAAGGGAPAGATTSLPAEEAVSAAAVDSAVSRLPSAAPSFPTRVPNRLPPAPAIGGRGPTPGAPGAATVPGAGTGQGQGQGSGNGNAIGNNPAGGRTGPGYGDRRLIVRPEAVPERELTEHERYMRGLAGRIQEYNDSVADEAARQRRARNWTFKDKNGREWGLGEGGVPIIAGRKIPVPIAPPIHTDRDMGNRERTEARQRDEINRQAEDVDRDRNFRERTRAIRERRDREREEERRRSGDGSEKDGGGSP